MCKNAARMILTAQNSDNKFQFQSLFSNLVLRFETSQCLHFLFILIFVFAINFIHQNSKIISQNQTHYIRIVFFFFFVFLILWQK